MAGAEPAVAGTVRASWRRCERYGVSEQEVEPVFTGALDTGSLFYACGQQVLRSLQQTLSGEPVSLMITDSEGLVLLRLHPDDGMRRSLDAVHLAPGFSYAERHAGTNGLGLALADRRPALVRGQEHWCQALKQYTCAAAPVLDPVTGALAGSINLTTWSQASSGLLLALAQSSASTTSALMVARAGGRPVREAPRGHVFHVQVEHGDGREEVCSSPAWAAAVAAAGEEVARGRVLALVGEPGSGRATLAALAHRRGGRRHRVLRARVPGVEDVPAWVRMWTPHLGAQGTTVVVSGVGELPAWAVDELAAALAGARRGDGHPQPFALVARDLDRLPAALGALVDAVVEAPPLRARPEDVPALAAAFARRGGHRAVGFTPAAERALRAHAWPGNVRRLREVVEAAAARTDVVDVQHLPPEVFTRGTRVLGRLEALERDEIVRALTEPGTSVARAAELLGVSRATVYRKVAQYDIALPR
ncbi:AAA-type ATPase lid domain-containing protein [Kineococcus indalonis]|uniref:helix-turn-helix domain-containing protein n=1 Tax=Kineococcus indalonis TaxID=2696566 RepID=UPI00196B6D31|nr:helix-turn-helix domain-containing protein [Kineococcus indalonis]